MLSFVIVGLALFILLRFMVVIYADHRALDRLGKELDDVPNLPSKEKEMVVRGIKGRLDEIARRSVWRRALDLTIWQASGWFEWMKEEGK